MMCNLQHYSGIFHLLLRPQLTPTSLKLQRVNWIGDYLGYVHSGQAAGTSLSANGGKEAGRWLKGSLVSLMTTHGYGHGLDQVGEVRLDLSLNKGSLKDESQEGGGNSVFAGDRKTCL